MPSVHFYTFQKKNGTAGLKSLRATVYLHYSRNLVTHTDKDNRCLRVELRRPLIDYSIHPWPPRPVAHTPALLICNDRHEIRMCSHTWQCFPKQLQPMLIQNPAAHERPLTLSLNGAGHCLWLVVSQKSGTPDSILRSTLAVVAWPAPKNKLSVNEECRGSPCEGVMNTP